MSDTGQTSETIPLDNIVESKNLKKIEFINVKLRAKELQTLFDNNTFIEELTLTNIPAIPASCLLRVFSIYV